MSKKSFFITLEGTDGVGKTTQARLLKEWLETQGYDVLLTREPGGGNVAEKIRGILLDPDVHLENLTELFLYEAARVEHLNKIVLPALKLGRIVLCDRFADATVAYQGYARGLMKDVHLLNKIATQGHKPDLTLLLNLPPSIGIQKAFARSHKNGKGDRLENEGLAFQKKVQKGYLQLQKKESSRIKLIPVQDEITATQELIRNEVRKKLK